MAYVSEFVKRMRALDVRRKAQTKLVWIAIKGKNLTYVKAKHGELKCR